MTADGALYFSSAGNEGNIDRRHVRQLRGRLRRLRPARRQVRRRGARLRPRRRRPGRSTRSRDDSAPACRSTLFWADPLGARRRRLRPLPVRRRPATCVDFSRTSRTATTTRTRSSARRSAARPAAGRRASSPAADRYFQLTALRGRFADAARPDRPASTPGVTRGHSAAGDAFSVAAAPAADPLPFDLEPGDPPNPTGPVPERRSPRRSSRSASPPTGRGGCSSTPTAAVTPATSPHRRQVRQKPDITAADGVHDLGARLRAVLRHLGGRAARGGDRRARAVRQPGQRRRPTCATAFDATALDLAPAGVRPRTGHGILRADRVLAYTGATPQPLVRRRPADGDARDRRRRRVPRAGGDGDARAAGHQRRRRDRRPASASRSPRRPAGDDHAARRSPTATSPRARPRSRDFTVTLPPATRSASRVRCASG